MTLPELKKLDKIIALCRKRGVSEITIEGVTIKLGDEPEKRAPKSASAVSTTKDDIETDGISQEELLFWSSMPEAPSKDEATL